MPVESNLHVRDEHDDFDDNEDQLSDINPKSFKSFRVYSRDWTIGTIVDQIEQANIDLDPDFQRRNAWTDAKRSALIESLILGIPIPQLVFAEDAKRDRAFLVIDGKQRLLTVAGFMNPSIGYWKKPQLRELTVLSELNGKSYAQLLADRRYSNDVRKLSNADMRCSIITTGSSNEMLYYVFYRLNSGSVTLSTQELRQALNLGSFTKYLIDTTSTRQRLHDAMSLSQPDPRFRDTEVLLRYLAFSLWHEDYAGNLKEFLDETLVEVNNRWAEFRDDVIELYSILNRTISKLESVLGKTNVGKRPEGTGFLPQFNRALFEVEVLFFKSIPESVVKSKARPLRSAIMKLCNEDSDFVASITSTTKSKEQYQIRFAAFADSLRRIVPPRYVAEFDFGD